ncbi:hypothetical protein KGM_206109 [Danaus plexippus plexippus]|uniref:Uncharacterized protein n=1 Tax=Danaus plexippus plexippus TaxID=278856 RepID=A0A212EU57_DANPL|nr:hypothetical protein KGM_206109 [Danaus plexippus plexippus]
MAEEAKKTIHLKIPFKSKEQSTLVSEVLGVDKELKGSGINKTININDDGLLVLILGTLT